MLVPTRRLSLLLSNRLVSFVHAFQPFARLFVGYMGARKIHRRKERFLPACHRTDPPFLSAIHRGMRRTMREFQGHLVYNKHSSTNRCLQNLRHIVPKAGSLGCREKTKMVRSGQMFHVLYHLLDHSFLNKVCYFGGYGRLLFRDTPVRLCLFYGDTVGADCFDYTGIYLRKQKAFFTTKFSLFIYTTYFLYRSSHGTTRRNEI